MKNFVKFTKQNFRGVTFNEYTKSLLEYLPLWAKNNSVIISAMEKLRNKNVYYILCGVGEKESKLKEQANKAGLFENIRFLGYRNDVKELYEAADCFVMPSFREGLSRSIMEAIGERFTLRGS